MLKVSDEDVWYWHTHCEKQKDSGLGVMAYARQFGVDYKKFSNYRYRIVYKRYSEPEEYKKLVNYAVQYRSSGLPIGKFCDEKKVNRRLITETVTHLQYLDKIERMVNERKELLEATKVEEPKMNFVQIATQPQAQAPSVQPPQEAELVEKQNDIEIIISKGVKVSISPNIDSMKIIKIIELLKDL